MSTSPILGRDGDTPQMIDASFSRTTDPAGSTVVVTAWVALQKMAGKGAAIREGAFFHLRKRALPT